MRKELFQLSPNTLFVLFNIYTSVTELMKLFKWKKPRRTKLHATIIMSPLELNMGFGAVFVKKLKVVAFRNCLISS